MSGGEYEYIQYRMRDVADEIEQLVKTGMTTTNWGTGEETQEHYPEDIKQEMMEAVELLRKASVYVQRIDWLVSGDDGEDSFRRRLKEDLEELK